MPRVVICQILPGTENSCSAARFDKRFEATNSLSIGAQKGPRIGVRPWGWTVSSGSFDRLLGALILELRWAEMAASGV